MDYPVLFTLKRHLWGDRRVTKWVDSKSFRGRNEFAPKSFRGRNELAVVHFVDEIFEAHFISWN